MRKVLSVGVPRTQHMESAPPVRIGVVCPNSNGQFFFAVLTLILTVASPVATDLSTRREWHDLPATPTHDMDSAQLLRPHKNRKQGRHCFWKIRAREAPPARKPLLLIPGASQGNLVA